MHKTCGVVRALDGISLQVSRGEFCSILGPSGCGKTTLLRVIAGFEQPDTGHLEIAGKPAADLPPQKRPVNTVFQSYALFPHLTVFQNVEFGLKMRGVEKSRAQQRVNDAMDLVEIGSLARRFPAQLSGGQKQRVALARALVNEPELLLLDEPLAAVDAQLRKQLQGELRTLQRRLGITFLYVTHDQEEALTMSDKVVLMNHGRIVQEGNPREVYESPASRFVASFLGASNIFEGRPQGSCFHTAFGELHLRTPVGSAIAVRAEHIRLAEGGGEPNSFPAIVEESAFNGAQTEMVVRIGDTRLRMLVPNSSRISAQVNPGNHIWIQIPPEAVLPLED